MFIWFVFRDSSGNPWQSGLDLASRARRSRRSRVRLGRAADRRLDDRRRRPARRVHVTMFVPYLAHYSEPGATIGMTYFATNAQGKTIAVGQPTATLAADQSVTFTPAFTPVKGQTYTVVATLNEAERAQRVAHGVHHGHLSLVSRRLPNGAGRGRRSGSSRARRRAHRPRPRRRPRRGRRSRTPRSRRCRAAGSS